MNSHLLINSLNKIDSLKRYYEIEKENVKQIAEEKNKHLLGAIIKRYFDLLTSSNEDVKKSNFFLSIEKESLKYIKVSNVSTSDDQKIVSFQFLSDEAAKKVGNVKEESDLFHQFEEMPFILGSSTLIMLITRFEEFISSFLSKLYVKYPERYLNHQQLAFSEIQSGNLEEIKKRLVNREVEAKMFESFKEWFKIYESHNLNSEPFKNDLILLGEIYARRNIIVHNSGKVNSMYLKSVPYAKEKIGTRLNIDESYMSSAFDTINRIVILMMIGASKLCGNNENEYLRKAFKTIFDLLIEEEYAVCEPAFSELCKKTVLSTEVKTMAKVNKWICDIELRGLDEVKEDINAFDVSALSMKFHLAKEILLKKYDSANKLLANLLTNKELNTAAIEEWPLFKHYRASEYYSMFKNQFPEEFKMESTEIDQQSIYNFDKQKHIENNFNVGSPEAK